MSSPPDMRHEWPNVATHGVGLALSLAGASALLGRVSLHAGVRPVASAWVFSATLVLLYAASTLYHAAPQGGIKQRLRVLDHCAIFLLIAGSYTPFALVGLRGRLGWSVLTTIWTLALVGICLKTVFAGRGRQWSTSTYVAMGWLGLVVIGPITHDLRAITLEWLLAGAGAYTAGALVFHYRRLPHHHALFHLLTVLGSACHFMAVRRLLLIATTPTHGIWR
ncbi:MAG TPA: hemolysin III family protein [Gammaproteobacteria bacterium]|nr:hemolysin III family protein [Gammaproteobacteria bacterium]